MTVSKKNYKNPSDFLFSFFNFFNLFFPMVFVWSGSSGEEPDMAAFMRGRKWGARKGLAPHAALLEEPGVFSETPKLGRLGVLLATAPEVSTRMSNILMFPVLRIRDGYPESRIRMFLSRILDPE
jgi:hypothetical protein